MIFPLNQPSQVEIVRSRDPLDNHCNVSSSDSRGLTSLNKTLLDSTNLNLNCDKDKSFKNYCVTRDRPKNNCNILIWNMQGFRNLHDVDSQLKSCSIFCFYETWLLKELKDVPIALKNFELYQSVARKEYITGRGSGGIIIGVRKNKNNSYQSKILILRSEWIFIEFLTPEINFIIGAVYLKPSINFESVCEELDTTILNLRETFKWEIFILGDFNARVGQLNNDVDFPLLHDQCCFLFRNSMDLKLNKKGVELVGIMERNSMILLNGRMRGDHPGNFTYVSHNGKSTIDLVWAHFDSLRFCSNLEILNTVTKSDHFPLLLNLNMNVYNGQSNSNLKRREWTKFNWDSEIAGNFRKLMEFDPRVQPPRGLTTTELSWRFINAVTYASDRTHVTTKGRFRTNVSKNPEWFDKECSYQKRKVASKLRQCRLNNFEEIAKEEYLSAKKTYRNLTKTKKRSFFDKITLHLSHCKDSKEFWIAINKFRKPRSHENKIPAELWSKYLREIYPRVPSNEVFLYGVAHPTLDAEISLEELERCVQKCKLNKAPGTDGIRNEIFKVLPQNWMLYLLTLFNKILETETVPEVWGNLKLKMIPKKGDLSRPENYRGIALVNCIVKLFTNIICDRLTTWCESNKLLPESQSGFRGGRGCIDNLFVLQALICNHLRLEKRKMYAVFVDFKRAFDSVSHELLWIRLLELGISAKLIRIIKNLYDRSVIAIEIDKTLTESVSLNTGVLQGETLSPLLFILFIADLEDFLARKNIKGVSINGNLDIRSLQFADDLVLFADTAVQAQNVLHALHDYTKEKQLVVNTNKTKVLIFKRGRTAKCKFHYGNDIIEVVKEYQYLGVTFSSSGLFLKNVKNVVRKANVAMGSVFSTLVKSKLNHWESRLKLMNAVFGNTLLYAAVIWSIRYLNVVEKNRVSFFKRLLNIPQQTPKSLVRLETDTYSVELTVLKHTLAYVAKIFDMDSDRYPKICFNRLNEIDVGSACKYSWVAQVKQWLSPLGISLPQHSLDKKRIDSLLLTARENLRKRDTESARNSNYPLFYKSLLDSKALYLLAPLPLAISRVIAQMRLMSKEACIVMYVEGQSHKIDSSVNCPVCKEHETRDSLEHMLFMCSAYNNKRPLILQGRDLIALLRGKNVNAIKQLYNFITQALRIRASIVMNSP